MLKTFCEDPKATLRFGLHLVERVKTKAPKRYRPLIEDAVIQIHKRLAKLSRPASQAAWDALRPLEQSQNEIEHHRWADVRIIHNRQALLAEHTLRCALRPSESSYWGYRMAAFYAERYDPRYGTGLIPDSANALKEIIAFWSDNLNKKSCLAPSVSRCPKVAPAAPATVVFQWNMRRQKGISLSRRLARGSGQFHRNHHWAHG